MGLCPYLADRVAFESRYRVLRAGLSQPALQNANRVLAFCESGQSSAVTVLPRRMRLRRVVRSRAETPISSATRQTMLSSSS